MNARLCWSRLAENDRRKSKIMESDAGGKYKGDSRKLLRSTFRNGALPFPLAKYWISYYKFFHSKNALGHIKQKKNKCNPRISEVPQCIVLFLAFHSEIYLLFTPFLYSESQTQERHKAVQKYFLRKPLFFDHKIDTATKLLNYVVKAEWSKLYFKRVDLSASGFYQQGPWLL